jgi:hypothetical protein
MLMQIMISVSNKMEDIWGSYSKFILKIYYEH